MCYSTRAGDALAPVVSALVNGYQEKGTRNEESSRAV